MLISAPPESCPEYLELAFAWQNTPVCLCRCSERAPTLLGGQGWVTSAVLWGFLSEVGSQQLGWATRACQVPPAPLDASLHSAVLVEAGVASWLLSGFPN